MRSLKFRKLWGKTVRTAVRVRRKEKGKKKERGRKEEGGERKERMVDPSAKGCCRNGTPKPAQIDPEKRCLVVIGSLVLRHRVPSI